MAEIDRPTPIAPVLPPGTGNTIRRREPRRQPPEQQERHPPRRPPPDDDAPHVDEYA